MSKLSVETEFDKAVSAVATSMADCEVKKHYGTCSECDCLRCDVKSYQTHCMQSFAEVDKIRVYNTLARDLAQRLPEEKQSMNKWETFWYGLEYYIRDVGPWLLYAILFAVISLLGVILLVRGLCGFVATAQSLDDYDPARYALPGENPYAGYYRKHILDTLDKTFKYTDDLNKDGLVNCIDYAITFKLLWDKQYDPKNCEIVRNVSGSMNHLFIRVRQYSTQPWECIEPQAAKRDITRYFMEDFWDTYNPIYNIYGETEQWLKEVR